MGQQCWHKIILINVDTSPDSMEKIEKFLQVVKKGKSDDLMARRQGWLI